MAENKDKKKVKKFLKLLADSLDVKKDVSPSFLVTTFIKAVDTLPDGKLKNLVQSDSENCTRLLHSFVIKRRGQQDSLTKKKITSSSMSPGDVQKTELRSVTKGKGKKTDKSKKNKKYTKETDPLVVSLKKEPRSLTEIYLQEFVASSGTGVYSAALKFLTEFLSTVEKKQENICQGEPKKAGELAEEIKTNLSICHLQYQQIGKVSSKRRPSYRDIVASLLSIYVDMMVLSSRNEKKKKRIGQSVCSFVCYVAEQSHLLDILLQLTVIQPEDKKVVLPLVRRCLKLVSPEGSESTYLKYMLTVCSMYKIFSEMMAGVVNTARTVPAPDSFMKWVKDTSPSVADMMPSDNKFIKYQITKFLLEELTNDMISSMLDIFTLDDEEETESEEEDNQKEHAKRERSPDVTLKNLDQSALFYLDRSGGQKSEVEEETSLTNAEKSTLSSNDSASLLNDKEENEEKEIFVEIVSDSCDSDTDADQILLPEVTAHLQTEDLEMMSPIIDIDTKTKSSESQSQKRRKSHSESKLENDILLLDDKTELGTPKRSRRSSRINQDTEIKPSGGPLENLNRKRQNTEPICINDKYENKSVELPALDVCTDKIRKSVDNLAISSSDEMSSVTEASVTSARKRGRKSLGSRNPSTKHKDNTDHDDNKNSESTLTLRTRKRMSLATEDSDKSSTVKAPSRTERLSDTAVKKRTRSNANVKQDTNTSNSNIVVPLSITELSTSSNSNDSSCIMIDHTLGKRTRTVSELSDSSISSRTRHRTSGVFKTSAVDLTVPEVNSKILSKRSSRTRQSVPSNSVSSVIHEKTVDESDIEILELNTDDEIEHTEVEKSPCKSKSKSRGKSGRKSSVIPSLPPDEVASEVDVEVVFKEKKNETQTKRVSQRLKRQMKNDV